MASGQQASRKRSAQSEEYESDDGFVEDAPKSKKMKAANSKATVNTSKQVDDEGNPYWELSGKRRLQVSSFKGNTFVGVREFYEKDGKSLPGKKGIALSIDQYAAFVELLPQIESTLKDKGIDVPRPNYDRAKMSESENNQGDKDDISSGEEDSDEPKSKPSSSKLDKYERKKNHEATSDEDDED